MKHLLPFDELNVLRTKLESIPIDERTGKRKMVTEDIIDELLDLYLLTYGNGVEDSMSDLSVSEDEELLISATSPETVKSVIYEKVAGENFEDRIKEYAPQGDVESIMRVAETDSHRIYNQAVHGTAELSGLSWTKTWQTMRDPKVRETHDPLEGVTLASDEKFYTFDGDSAPYPGAFSSPSNNVNCRCVLRINPQKG